MDYYIVLIERIGFSVDPAEVEDDEIAALLHLDRQPVLVKALSMSEARLKAQAYLDRYATAVEGEWYVFPQPGFGEDGFRKRTGKVVRMRNVADLEHVLTLIE